MLVLLELLLFFVVIVVSITQIFIPIMRGTVLFPIFRKERILEEGIQKAKQNIVEEKLAKDLNNLTKKSNKN